MWFPWHDFSYSTYDVGGVKELSARMRRDLVSFVYEHLESFQSFDRVVVYYDEGYPNSKIISTSQRAA